MTQVTSAHLGESLGTDLFSVREQFTDEPVAVLGHSTGGMTAARRGAGRRAAAIG
jgi:alpha-beta hydrolase superfamily lysophospholipase